MARINIEDSWWAEPRRSRLIELLGSEKDADWSAMRFWKTSQDYWRKGELIPGHVFIHCNGAEAILKAGLARIYETKKIWLYPDSSPTWPNTPQRDPNEAQREANDCLTKWRSVRELSDLFNYYIYACGSRENHFWLVKGYLQRVEAGKKSAAKRKLLSGSAQPVLLDNEGHRTGPQRNPLPFEESCTISVSKTPNGPERPRTDPPQKSTTPNYSSSSSSSSSFSNKEKQEEEEEIHGVQNKFGPSALDQSPSTETVQGPKSMFDWEALYSEYPKRNGSQHKAAAIERLKSKIKTPDQYELFRKAILNYARHCRDRGIVGTELVSQFKTFAGTVWQEWINPERNVVSLGNGLKSKHEVLQEQTDAAFAAVRAEMERGEYGN